EGGPGFGPKSANPWLAVFSRRVDASPTFIGGRIVVGCDLHHAKQCSKLRTSDTPASPYTCCMLNCKNWREFKTCHAPTTWKNGRRSRARPARAFLRLLGGCSPPNPKPTYPWKRSPSGPMSRGSHSTTSSTHGPVCWKLCTTTLRIGETCDASQRCSWSLTQPQRLTSL